MELFHLIPCLFQDIWHNMHGGLGRNFISSAVAECLPNMLPQPGGIDGKFQILHAHYDNWRKGPGGMRLHHGKIDADTFGLTSLQVVPTASWSKFADTRVLLAWLQILLTTDLVARTSITDNILTATRAVNEAFSILYGCGVWLSSCEARRVGAAGLLFLRMYAELAAQTLYEGRSRFAITPKAHFLHHCFLDLYESQRRWTMSPLTFSVQLDEDVVGRISRFSRRVGSQLLMERTLGRYKVAAWLALSHAQKQRAVARVDFRDGLRNRSSAASEGGCFFSCGWIFLSSSGGCFFSSFAPSRYIYRFVCIVWIYIYIISLSLSPSLS